MLYLRIVRGPGREECLTVEHRNLPFTIGRDRDNKLSVQTGAVSRYHAVIVEEDGAYYVQDQDSTNGTFLNGKRIKKSRIRPGDTVSIANVEIIVESSPAPSHHDTDRLDLSVTIEDPIRSDSTLVVRNPTEQLFRSDVHGPSDLQDLSKSYSALQVLYRADQVLRDIEDYQRLLENFMDLICEVLPSSRAYIFVLNRENGMPVPLVRRAASTVGSDTEIVVSKTIIQTAVEKRESLLSSDALIDERFIHSKSIVDQQVRSAICAPLVNRGRVLGIIYLDSTDQSNLYTEDDLSLLSAMALKAGIALDNAQLYDDSRNLLVNTVETLVRAIQARDKYTSGHSARVTRYALQIAERMGLNTKEKHHLYLTAMLHDIGKIGVPDDLLNRPGKLSQTEIDQVRDHVKLGASMLRSLGEMHPIVPLILHHHEAYDGSGYPDGLKGKKIPLISRIVAVADTFDAMTSDRPYRKARSRAEAVAELKRCAGTAFDPEIVNIFLRILNRGSTDVVDPQPEPTTEEPARR